MLKMKEELVNESESEDDNMSIRDNAIYDSPQGSDQEYLTDGDNVYNDEEEVVEQENGLLGTFAGRILVPESLK
jgi:hypothetical protein